MASLVLELQKEALNSSVPISDLLRKALVVARKLNIDDFKLWVESELNGYNRGLAVPEYRIIKGQIKLWNPYNGWIDFFLDPNLANKLSRMPDGQPIGEIESLLKSSKPTFQMQYPKEVEYRLMEIQEPPALKPSLLVSISTLSGIIEIVRNIVLEWSLKLEEDGIHGEGMTFTKDEKLTASSTTYHVKNFIEHMSNSQIQQDTHNSAQTMSINDIDISKLSEVLKSIKDSIKQLGLESIHRDELLAEIATVESQASSPKPKKTIIRESLASIRNILEGAAGSLVAAGLLKQLETLF